MSRTKLRLPTDFSFSTEVPVRVSDVNYGGHLGNDRVLALIHEARVRFLNHYGFTELDVDGTGTIMTDAVIIYKSEAFYGDLLKIEVAADNFHKYGCDLFYRLTKRSNGREIARAKTGITFFDYEKRKIAPMPQKFQQLFTPSAMKQSFN